MNKNVEENRLIRSALEQSFNDDEEWFFIKQWDFNEFLRKILYKYSILFSC